LKYSKNISIGQYSNNFLKTKKKSFFFFFFGFFFNIMGGVPGGGGGGGNGIKQNSIDKLKL
jgi:hypothetical protein